MGVCIATLRDPPVETDVPLYRLHSLSCGVAANHDQGHRSMSREEAITKLISVRHNCFVRGVLGRNPDPDFR
jgi:hypothetical protein